MWICLNNAFLSIVSPEDLRDVDNLLVRARRPGDIERIFPGHTAETLDGRDYQFRALIPRKLVGATIATHLSSITYRNFKGSTRDHGLHTAYNSVWGIMARLQPQRPYSRYHNARPAPVQRSLEMASTARTSASTSAVARFASAGQFGPAISTRQHEKPANDELVKLDQLVADVRKLCGEHAGSNDWDVERSLQTSAGTVRVMGIVRKGAARVSFKLAGKAIARTLLDSKLKQAA